MDPLLKVIWFHSVVIQEIQANEVKKVAFPSKKSAGHQDTSSTQSAFTFSKLTIETLEQGMKYVQS